VNNNKHNRHYSEKVLDVIISKIIIEKQTPHKLIVVSIFLVFMRFSRLSQPLKNDAFVHVLVNHDFLD